MSALDRATLKTFFETGDVPTEPQFGDFIDSSPNFVDDISSIPLSVRVPITTAQFLDINSTPVQIIPAPVAGLATELIRWSMALTFNTTKYSTFTNLELLLTGSTARSGFLSAFLPSTQSVFQTGQVVTGLSTNDINIVDNAAMFLSSITGNPTGGDSDGVAYALFRLITV